MSMKIETIEKEGLAVEISVTVLDEIRVSSTDIKTKIEELYGEDIGVGREIWNTDIWYIEYSNCLLLNNKVEFHVCFKKRG